MDHYAGAVDAPSTGEGLARVADELLEEARALRAHYEELKDALDGVPVTPPVEPERNGHAEGAERERGVPQNLRAMALQAAFAGEEREAVKEQFRLLDVPGAEEIVDEVFDSTEQGRPEQRRRLFLRRSH